MTLSRRDFLKGAATAGAAAVVGVDLLDLISPDDLLGYQQWLARAAVERYNLVAYSILNNRMFPISEPWMYKPWDYGFTSRIDRRRRRRLKREDGREARGVRRYQGLRR